MAELFRNRRIILASASPRRQMLLSALDIPFEVIVKEIEEVCPEQGEPEKAARCIAERKSLAFNLEAMEPVTTIITADTVVALDGEIIGKPCSREEAIRMLNLLSGCPHWVYTGVCIRSLEKMVLFCDATKVWFRKFGIEEAAYYADHYHPYDKAGSYGIQEWIGYACVERIEGSYFNVMGLPTHRIYEELMRF